MTPFHLLFCLCLTIPVIPAAVAQPFPSKPIKVIVGYPPGGAVDIIARAVGQKLSAGLGQAVIIENKPGAGTNIAVRVVIDSAPDGSKRGIGLVQSGQTG